MAKTNFFKKNPMKSAGEILIHAGIRGVGTVGSAYAVSVIGQKIFADMPKKYFALGCLAIGLAGEVFLGNPYAVSLAQGVTSTGILFSTGAFVMPDKLSNLGLSGAGFGEVGNSEDSGAEAESVAVYRRAMGAVDPLEDLNRKLDTVLDRSVNGFDVNYPENDAPNSAGNAPSANSAGGGGTQSPRPYASLPIASLNMLKAS